MPPVATAIKILLEINRKKNTYKEKEVNGHPCMRHGIHLQSETEVTFEATDDCMLVFSNPDFFGMPTKPLAAGKEVTLTVQPNKLKEDPWQTFYRVDSMSLETSAMFAASTVSGDPDPIIQP